MEVVVASADGRLTVLAPRPPAGRGAGFAAAPVLASASLAPPGPAMPGAEWRAVALGAGYVDPPPAAVGVAKPRARVVVALTAGLEVVALDHRLRELWRAPLLLGGHDGRRGQAALPAVGPPSHASIREAAILVTPHPLRPSDRGSVFVSASLRHGGGGREASDSAAAPDAVAASVAADAAGGARGHAPPTGEEDGTVKADVLSPDASHAPWTAALAGQSGARRWSAGGPEGDGSTKPATPTPPALRRQHDVRLDAAAVASARATADAHAGAACRDHREGVLSVLPHGWAGRGDTRVRLAHFAHRRAVGKGGGAGGSTIGPNMRRVGELGRAGSTSPSLARPGGGGGGNAVVAAAARAASAAGRGAARGPGGTPPPPPPGASGATLAAWHAMHKPNAVVLHFSGGLEVFHLHSGARVCGLKARWPGVTADLDADGVPDFATAVSTAGHGARVLGGDTAHAHARACEGVALGGVPPTLPLWNASLCHHHQGGGFGGGAGDLFGGGGGGSADSGGLLGGGASLASLAGIEASPPAVLALPRRRGTSGGPTRDASLVAFFVSTGEVTAVRGADGHLAWRAAVPGLSWRPHSLRASGSQPATPTLAAVALRPGGPPSALLVAGDRRCALLSPAGHVLASVDLPGAPLIPLASPADLDGDGLADVVLVTREGVFGYSQQRRGAGGGSGGAGGVPLSALVGCLVAAMVVVWWTQQAGGRVKGGRATDRED